MLKNFIILRTVLSFILPYIALYSFYIQINGEVSPGGGFQAGVIFASSIIAFDLIYDAKQVKKLMSSEGLIISGILGVMIYAITGAISLIFDDNYLNYNSIFNNASSQHFGIFVIEIGVGLTVGSVMCLIYFLLRKDLKSKK
jgi:multicomponent Na+:H+ antiporter subunit B